MTTQRIASSRPALKPHRRIRTAAAVTGVAALIAAGGYLATTIGPDAATPTPAADTDVTPSAQTLRELRQSIAGQYGNQFAATPVNPSAQTLRALRQSIPGQYGPAR